MKVKTDFVTNSSSTSFVAYGCEVTQEQLDKFEKKNGEDYRYESDLEFMPESDFVGVHPVDMLIEILGSDAKVKEMAAKILNERLGMNGEIKKEDIEFIQEEVYE